MPPRRWSRPGASPSRRSRPSRSRKNPPPPFTTSTLQQEAARKLGFSASHTMRVAQALYEDGLITYMRTDGVDMAPEAISAARRAIANRYDAGYVPDKPRQYQSKIKNAQEAHEAIRPTDFDRPRARVGRSCPALRAGLQPRAGQPDGLGAARADDGRADRRRGQGGASRDRPGRALPRLSRALRGRPRREGGRRGGRAHAGAARRRCAGEDRRRGDPALHPAAAALFRSEPGQAAGGARHRPAVDLRLDRCRR